MTPSTDRSGRDALVAWAIVAALVTVLVRINVTLPAIGHLGSALVAVLFLYAPVAIAWRRGEDLDDYGFHSAPMAKGLGTAAAAIAVIFPVFALGYFAFGSDVGLWHDVRFFRFICHMRLLWSHSVAQPARTSCAHRYSFHDRWARFDRSQARASYVLSPPPISPIAAPAEEHKEHEDNKNEVHHLPPKYPTVISLL